MLTSTERQALEQHIHGIDVSRLSAAFDALSEPNRCLIFRALLKSHGASVGDLAAVVGISAPLASQHLKVLHQAKLLVRHKSGKQVYYDLNRDDALAVALQSAVADNS